MPILQRELVVSGQFICEVTGHNCAGGGPEVGGAHEWCGLEPILPVALADRRWKAIVGRRVYYHPTAEPIWEWRVAQADDLEFWRNIPLDLVRMSGSSYDWATAYREARQAVLYLMVGGH